MNKETRIAIYKENENEDRFTLSFYLKTEVEESNVTLDRQFNMNRAIDEPASSFINRLQVYRLAGV